ncbi:hypothetical protein HMPREF0239_01697 [Clostridium sp. ATCC BAA-442]|nr:hypothetical protein HMPREF0239_01697 [Clostridium sp. ATCC BAA-442]
MAAPAAASNNGQKKARVRSFRTRALACGRSLFDRLRDFLKLEKS